MKKLTSLEQKVIAINYLNECSLKVAEHEKTRLDKLIGLKIFKVDGSFLAKYESGKLNFEDFKKDGVNYNCHYWFENSRITVKICVSGGTYEDKTQFCIYETKSLYFYKNENQILIADKYPTKIEDLKVVYNADEILKEAENVKIKAAEYEAATNKIPYEFKNVLYIERLTK